MNRYRKAMDQVQFSENIEEQLLEGLTEDKTADSDCGKLKHMIRYAAAGVFICCILCIYGMFHIGSTQQSSNPVLEETGNLPDVKTMREIEADCSEGVYLTDSIEICSGEMIVFHLTFANETDDVYTCTLTGSFSGTDLCYDVGCILSGNYSTILSGGSNSLISESIAVTGQEDCCWCIFNVSAESVFYKGNIELSAGNLLFRTYGDDIVEVNKACTIIIDTSGLSESLTKVCIYNCLTEELLVMENQSEISYKAEAPGTFIIYGITEEGGVISLADYVRIEYDVDVKSGFSPLSIKKISVMDGS